MNVVWALDQASGREVTDALSVEKPVAYTTVVTLMNILVGKGHLLRVPDGRQFRYRPKVSQKRALSGLVRDFVDRVFDGAVGAQYLGALKDLLEKPALLLV